MLVIGIMIGIPMALVLARWANPAIELRARLAEAGGWTPADLTADVGQPLTLHLTSDDVMHGFAIGQSDAPALDVPPGTMVETTLTFERPGKYTFYCTRWCGLGHWRMRGTIEVSGPTSEPVMEPQPLYVALGINVDADHKIGDAPSQRPSAERGRALGIDLPEEYLSMDYYRAHSPVDLRDSLRANGLSDGDAWDVVAFVWRSNTTSEALAEGQRLYAANCAACHGEGGAGDGVAANALANNQHDAAMQFGQHTQRPADFTDLQSMLGASPALLQGKIIRGGMGTGMPYWGPIFTEPQSWAVADYLWTFVFQYQEAQ